MARAVDAGVLEPRLHAKRVQQAVVVVRRAVALVHGDVQLVRPFDEIESVGTLSRSAGYEVWFKIAHGHPGSSMLRQVDGSSGAEQAARILDLLAALCDKQAFPALAASKDVPADDPRCGAYLR